MKIIFALALLVTVHGQANLDAIECPFPEGSSVESETECRKYSACIWEASASRCRMEDNEVAGYLVSSGIEDTGRGFKVSLSKSDLTRSMFNGDINELVFEVIHHEDYHIQIKIYDPANARYEVPFPISTPDAPGTSPLYSVSVSDNGLPFSFSVKRISTETTIFNALGPLSFEDQFIQLTTSLSSSYFYGIGETYHQTFRHSFNTRKTTPLFARDLPPGTLESNLYGVHPYYVNIEDDDGNTHSVLFYNSNAMEFSTFSLDDGTPALTYRTIGGIIDLHLFLGPSPEDVNAQYSSAIGTTVFPPYWALGFHLSRYGYGTLDNLKIIRQRMKDAGIPQDVQTCDIDYMDHYRDFTYDQQNWEGFPGYIDELHGDGVKVTLILDPALAIDFDNYLPVANGAENDVFIKWMDDSLIPEDQVPGTMDYIVGYVWPNNKTMFPDFLNPETKEWWSNECQTLHSTLPYDALWIDMNEPSNFATNMDRPFNYPSEQPDWSLKCPYTTYDSPPYPTKASYEGYNDCKRISDKTICMSSIQSNGSNSYLHYDVHSLYGLSETIATHESLQNVFPGKRQLILPRSTFSGTGSYAAHWLGDNFATWEQLKQSIVGVLEFNLFIIPFVGADICGFNDDSTESLCARWMQLGAFYPFSRNHNTLGAVDQDPANPAWPLVNSVSRDVLLLRYKYLPYLYLLFHKASMHGGSIARPLFNIYPTDVAARDVDDQFFWGDGIMIAPVVYENDVERNVYFPQALWYDLVDGTLASPGSETVLVDAPMEKIPVYARGGIILPFQEPDVTTTLSRANPFGLTVVLDETQSAEGQIFWDDGESSFSMEASFMSFLEFVNNTLTATIQHGEDIAAGLNYETVQFYGYPSNPSRIVVNGGEQDESSWYFDSNINVLTLTTNLPLSEGVLIELF